MAITVTWDDDEQTRVRCTFQGDWRWEELYAALDEGEKMAMGASRPVDAVIDMTHGSPLPGGAVLNEEARQNASKLANRAQPDRGFIAIVGAHPMLKTLFGLFKGLFGKQAEGVFFAESLDDARQKLTQKRM